MVTRPKLPISSLMGPNLTPKARPISRPAVAPTGSAGPGLDRAREPIDVADARRGLSRGSALTDNSLLASRRLERRHPSGGSVMLEELLRNRCCDVQQ
jgi:hypothetical protein